VPYPIPPAGADAATWRSEEAAAPLTFTLPVPDSLVVLAALGGAQSCGGGGGSGEACGAPGSADGGGGAALPQPESGPEPEGRRLDLRAGWWDEAAGCWSEEGIRCRGFGVGFSAV
jgi:hypothetical protein